MPNKMDTKSNRTIVFEGREYMGGRVEEGSHSLVRDAVSKVGLEVQNISSLESYINLLLSVAPG